jgi:hypothetical protein
MAQKEEIEKVGEGRESEEGRVLEEGRESEEGNVATNACNCR